MNQHLCKFKPFKTDIWTLEQQKDIYEQYLKVETLGDWVDLCSRVDFKLLMEVLSFDPAPYSQTDWWPIKRENWKFQTIHKLESIDFDAIRQRAIQLNEQLTPEEAEYKEARAVQRENWKAERDWIANFNLDKNPTIIYINKDNFPELMPWINAMELDYASVQMRNNYIGSNLPTHVDCLDHLWVKIDEMHPEEKIMERPFDHITKNVEGYYPIRLLMHIDDWEVGQCVGFGDQLWNWKAGETIMFDWQNSKHYATNVSYRHRFQVRITGYTTNPNHWIFDAVNNGTFRTL